MGTRTQRKGFLLKSEFCKKYGIKMTYFTEKLIALGLLVHRVHSTNCLGRKTYTISIADNKAAEEHIRPLHGSNQKGTYQYRENFFKIVFEIE
jgi:hypothetical protein